MGPKPEGVARQGEGSGEGEVGGRLNCLAAEKVAIGDLDRVKRVAKLLCMVNSEPEFGDQPRVANGATDLLAKLYGERGAHARSAVGMGGLPNGQCIEIEMILEVES